MAKPSACITGSNGFVGSHLAEQLSANGFEVHCMVRKTSNLRWIEPLDVRYVYSDLQDFTRLQSVFPDVDYVFHCGGVTKAQTRDAYFNGNAEGTQHLLEAVLKNCPRLKRFVYVSTQAAAGPCARPEPIDETVEPHPVTWYGESKLEAEKITMECASRLPVTIVRPPTVYGPRDTDVYEAFKSIRMHMMATVGFQERLVSLIYVADLVRGLLLAAQSETAAGKLYHLTSDTRVDWMAFNREIAEAMNVRAVPVYVPFSVFAAIAAIMDQNAKRTGRTHIINRQKLNEYREPYWLIDGSAATRDFGYKPEYCMTRGVRLTLDWYQSNGWL